MIASLSVENIALINSLQIDFADGLNVLSGETGAGKSILLDAVNLILGERAERSLIRHGADSARVEATVYTDGPEVPAKLEELGIPFEEEIVVTRELTGAGRSVCRVNGRTVTLAALRSLMGGLVDLHGQHEHQALLDASSHTGLLDAMAGAEASELGEKIAARYRQLSKAGRELDSLGGTPEEREDAMDLLRFEIDELEKAGVEPGELENLQKEQRRIQNLGNMERALHEAYGAVYGDDRRNEDVMGLLGGAIDQLEDCSEFDERVGPLLETYREAYYSIEDASGTLSSVIDGLELDEERASEVEERIDEIHRLLRKYRTDEEGLGQKLASYREKLKALTGAEERIKTLHETIEKDRAALRKLYMQLSRLRKKTAKQFASDLLLQLRELGMEDARFEVTFSGLEEGTPLRYAPTSPENAEFFLSVNRGEPLKPLSKVASGGEISRIMLAFKVISAEHDGIETLIFDEIDTGISGRTAQVVGEKMAQLAMSRQVIAVTHLPQIAVMGDRNFYIHKENKGKRTFTHIDRLGPDGVRAEMVRLTGGLESANAEAHADEMMESATRAKERLREAQSAGQAAASRAEGGR